VKTPRICVVGACMMDLISYVPRLPRLGETLHGSRFAMGFGGKGANQAVMASRLGATVDMVARVGGDSFGSQTRANFNREGVDTRHVLSTPGQATGAAPIAVDPDGSNSIIIVAGANGHLSEEDVSAAAHVIRSADMLVCQLEVPPASTLCAMRLAKDAGVPVLFNPAPAPRHLDDVFYPLCDILCPNEMEAEGLTGINVVDPETAAQAAKRLVDRGAPTVIVTLGERGCLLRQADRTEHFPAESVETVDTTGAGDAFVGSLATFLAAGCDLETAIAAAGRVAALSVCAEGTQTSFPAAGDLPADLPAVTSPGEKDLDLIISSQEMAACIDHTLLKPEAPAEAIDTLCGEARAYGFKAVCVNSCHVARASDRLADADVAVCAVVGFPLGSMESRAKAFEARQAVADGAVELDMVINVGALKAGDLDGVEADIRAVREAAGSATVLKVILETCLLTDAEKVVACDICKRAGADFVKTSTGFQREGPPWRTSPSCAKR
jgi:ribokinase